MTTHNGTEPGPQPRTEYNADTEEIARFDAVAAHWWDTEGDFRPLHDINPLRANYIDRRCGGVAGKRVLDIGCGGGLLAEALAHRGATVLGIDLSPVAIEVATQHAANQGLDNVSYRLCAVESLHDETPFDVITCLEMLEHVPDPQAIIEATVPLLKPGGHLVVSTLNRTPTAFAKAILGAEYIMRLIPPGTHEYARFIKPSELATWARKAGYGLHDERGIAYNPLLRTQRLTKDVSVNYLMHFTRPQ